MTLSWNTPAGGCAPTSYGIEAGSGPGLSNLASTVTGNTVNGFSADGVPDGTYFVRVRGGNVIGFGPASNEIRLVVGSNPVSPFFGTFNITANKVTDTGCNFLPSFTGQLQLSGNTVGGNNLTARMVERLTRLYAGTVQFDGSFSGSGSGNLDGFI